MDFIKKLLASSARAVIALLLLTCATQVVEAQDNTKSFSVCALNVDGLPNEILGIKINPDGKGADGATAIGQYLRKSGVDIMALSEDFNYHNNLVTALGDGYNIGTYRGGISSDKYKADVSFDTDGLEFITKSPLTFADESWTAWKQTYGKFTNGSDELINKGYRFYTVDFGDGVLVDFYTMHMDADTDPKDNAARASQWEQLRDAILANRNNGHAVIVMGDTNSRYTRDNILSLFIRPIEESGQYTVTDAWINLCKDGEYPELDNSERLVIPDDKKTDPDAYRYYEIVDKVLFLNPVNYGNSTTLTANSITFDAARYQSADDELLGDHVPVIVNFTATHHVDHSTLNPCSAEKWWNGEQIEGNGQEVYIYNVGKKYFISHDANPTVTDIDSAPTWFVRSQDNGYTFDSDIYRLHMEYQGSWNTSIKENSGATTFTAMQSDGTQVDGEYVYKFANTRKKVFGGTDTRYFNIDINGGSIKYTAATTTGTANDWLLISPKQKQTYDTYVDLFNKAKSYLDNESLNSDVRTKLENTLETTSRSYYLRSQTDIKALEDIIAEMDKILTGVSIPTEVKNVHIVGIYTVDGKRIATMRHGINIVRMSDGTVKKVVK